MKYHELVNKFEKEMLVRKATDPPGQELARTVALMKIALNLERIEETLSAWRGQGFTRRLE